MVELRLAGADPEPLADATTTMRCSTRTRSGRARAGASTPSGRSPIRGASCRFGEPVVAGDRAAVDWWGVITANDGSVETVAGTSLLRFGADGRVVEQRDAWAGEAATSCPTGPSQERRATMVGP